MKKYEKIYLELRKTYSDEEIADSMLIPADLTEEEQKKANEELMAFRMKLLQEQTEDQRIYSDLLRFRYQIENYLKLNDYSIDMSFGNLVAEYARILKRTKKQLSIDLDIHYTRLSRIINGHEEPNVELTYRLEKHSGELVPALIWWKLMIKKQEYNIRQNKQMRREEASKVKNSIRLAI